jgi:hypothetical protein
MSPEEFESQLSQFETQLALLSVALTGTDANELLAAAAELQSMTVVFSKVMHSVATDLKDFTPLRLRLQKIAASLGSLRVGLMRYGVVVERALAALVPATQNITYAPILGGYARQPYPCPGRQSGEFRVVAA